LGATILLEGGSCAPGRMIGVMARLTDAETGRVIWETVSGRRGGPVGIRMRCARAAAALKLSVSAEVGVRSRGPPTNIGAFELYSRAEISLSAGT
jgi:hypothetical protein